MPKKDCILNLPGYSIKKVSGENPVLIEVSYRRVVRCIHCGNKKLRIKDSFMRRIRHESIGLRRSYLCIQAHKYYCSLCNRYFNQRFPGIGKHQRATESLRKQVFHYHSKGVSQKDLARDLRLGKSTVERWYHYGYELRHKKILNRACPRVLGLDEHSFNRKVGYATTFCDLAKHKIFDVVAGRSAKDLESYLNTLEGRERVLVVCIDLSSSYRSLIKRYFPNAKIVADRFHVIRLLNQMCLQTYQQIDPQMKHQRGLLAALRTNEANLTIKRLNGKEPTFGLWKDEIARMWRFSKSNGITEGFHRKMKLIHRRAFGFRNFESYRVRVRVLCG